MQYPRISQKNILIKLISESNVFSNIAKIKYEKKHIIKFINTVFFKELKFFKKNKIKSNKIINKNVINSIKPIIPLQTSIEIYPLWKLEKAAPDSKYISP